jgi:uncharacterized membrane protein YfcA
MPEFPDLSSTDMLIAIGVATGAGLMRGFAGFGSGMLMAPVFAVLFGPVDTVAMVILLEIVATAQIMPGVRADIQWRFVASMGVVAAVFMPLGSWLLVSADPKLLTRAIAVIVLAFVLVLMTGWRYRGEKRNSVAMGIGAISGAMMAATSLGNPPVMLYMLSGPDGAAVNRANVTAYFALTLSTLLLLMLAGGLVTWGAASRVAVLLPVFLLTAWIGGRLFHGASESLYRFVALAFLFCAGLFGLLS